LKKQNESEDSARIVFFSHGGGPLPILGDAGHKAMVEFMRRLPSELSRPDAILVISAHWEESTATLLGADTPPMLYDYYGFPGKAYKITYPAPGSPDLANRIAGVLRKHNLPAHIDPQRGFDHGLFVPLKLMYPHADIPSLQLSLLRGLDPANDDFQNWLIEVCTGAMSRGEREQRLIEWEKAPSARYCHPREEHLLPLHVCVGMSDKPAKLVFDDYILGKRGIALLW
jgi:aromatic ring-opening dioxygenase catalytic subunit (LigB family)